MKLGWDIVAGRASGRPLLPRRAALRVRRLPRQPLEVVEDARTPARPAPRILRCDGARGCVARSRARVAPSLVMNVYKTSLASALAAALLCARRPPRRRGAVTLFAGYSGINGDRQRATNSRRRHPHDAATFRRRDWLCRSTPSRELQLLLQPAVDDADAGRRRGAVRPDGPLPARRRHGVHRSSRRAGPLRRRRGGHDAVQPRHGAAIATSTSRRRASASATTFRWVTRFALRAEARGYVTFVNSSGGFLCSGGCVVVLKQRRGDAGRGENRADGTVLTRAPPPAPAGPFSNPRQRNRVDRMQEWLGQPDQPSGRSPNHHWIPGDHYARSRRRQRGADPDRDVWRKPEGHAADPAWRPGRGRSDETRIGAEGQEIGHVVFGHVLNTEPKDMYLGRVAAVERRRGGRRRHV